MKSTTTPVTTSMEEETMTQEKDSRAVSMVISSSESVELNEMNEEERVGGNTVNNDPTYIKSDDIEVVAILDERTTSETNAAGTTNNNTSANMERRTLFSLFSPLLSSMSGVAGNATGSNSNVTSDTETGTEKEGISSYDVNSPLSINDVGSDTETIPNNNFNLLNNNNNNPTAIKVLFLSSDTGGGHRASAESLGKQFEILFPGSTYDLLDVVEEDFGPPYNSLVSLYKHLSAHPSQWKLLYTISNSRGFEMIADAHFKLMFERAIRKSIKKYHPDVVVSVHPMMTNVPVLSCKRISNETGFHLPMFTVVTDLGSAHCLWFANGVEKMFVGSERVKELAKVRGKVPEEKLVLSGLPIRHDFAVQAERMGDRMSPHGKAYQQHVRADLMLPYTHRNTLLLMGGGEGVGSLSTIVDALYVELVSQGIDALILVVCGRNEKLKASLEERDWAEVFQSWQSAKNRDGMSKSLMSFGDSCGVSMSSPGCIESATVTGSIRRMLSSGTLAVGNMMSSPEPSSPANFFLGGLKTSMMIEEKKADEMSSTSPNKGISTISLADENTNSKEEEVETEISACESAEVTVSSSTNVNTKAAGDVHVLGLGFVTRMAEFMVAADILVTKAGPGTISEAAALSLPVMLTSFLPGQEEGNVDYVIDGGFGAYVHDSDPIGVAEEICMWLTNYERRAKLSVAAKAHGTPYAARDIVQQIGDSTLKWKEINQERAVAIAAANNKSS